MARSQRPFWQSKTLEQMTKSEWEALCDGCGKCCLNKLEDEDTGEILFTNVACRLFDAKTCRCSNYVNRRKFVPDCHQLTPKKVRRFSWLPKTCAYRLVDEGQDLPDWHHLKTGSRQTIHRVGASVRNQVFSEVDIPLDDFEDYVVDWLG
jgi:hypothetical protein